MTFLDTLPKLTSALGVLLSLAGALPLLSASTFSVPISDKVVQLEIFPSDVPNVRPDLRDVRIKATVRDGTMLTISDEETGQIYGVLPYLDNSDQVNVIFFAISNLPTGGQKAKQIEKDDFFSRSSQMSLPNLSDLSLRLLSTAVWQFPNIRPIDARKVQPAELQKTYGKAGGGICCTSCGQLTVCATAVDMGCGSCTTSAAPRLK